MTYQGLIWTGVFVEDLEASAAFYRDVLGLRLLEQGGDWAQFDAGGGAMLELMTGGTAAVNPKDPALQPVVVGLRVDDLDRTIMELKVRGILFGEIGQFDNTRWAHFSDLEGNQLEIKEIPGPAGRMIPRTIE